LGVAVTTASCLAVGIGEREFHDAAEENESDRTQTVSDKASVCGTITVSGNQMTPDQITIPRALVCNILFKNLDDGTKRSLVLETGEGTHIETGAVEAPSSQLLTVRLPNTGVYELRVEGDGDDIVGSITVL
jgi:hypothetical protein